MYDSTFSSFLSPRSARKTQVRSRKKHRNAKNTFGSRKKNCSGKKLFPQRGKTPAKNPLRREKIQSSRKNTLQQQKTPLQQIKCILEAAGKNRPRQEKARRRQEKTGRGRTKNQQQRKPSFATQKGSATEKIHFRNGKKQQPLMALGWLWWRAWVPVDAVDAAALCVPGGALGDIRPSLCVAGWHLATSTLTWRVGAALDNIDPHFAWQAWHLGH